MGLMLSESKTEGVCLVDDGTLSTGDTHTPSGTILVLSGTILVS